MQHNQKNYRHAHKREKNALIPLKKTN